MVETNFWRRTAGRPGIRGLIAGWHDASKVPRLEIRGDGIRGDLRGAAEPIVIGSREGMVFRELNGKVTEKGNFVFPFRDISSALASRASLT